MVKPQDIVIGNLENPLVDNGVAIANKCVLRGTTAWAKRLKGVGFDILSLANNHMMDFGTEGLNSTIEVLKTKEIQYVGAGTDINEARLPVVLHLGNKKLLVLARSSVVVASRSYAEKNHPGIAYFDKEELCRRIFEYRKEADFIILLMHWGIEHYSYPSPAQRQLAKDLVAVGADLILGHHPHVLQGYEFIGNSLVCYSLGNFLFDDIPWRFTDEQGNQQNKVVKLKEPHRKGMMLRVSIAGKGRPRVETIPTRIAGDGVVVVDEASKRYREIEKLNSRLNWPAYSMFWKLYSLTKEWQLRIWPRFSKVFSWDKVKKVRPHHFSELVESLRRSSRITSGKSTNPYE